MVAYPASLYAAVDDEGGVDGLPEDEVGGADGAHGPDELEH